MSQYISTQATIYQLNYLNANSLDGQQEGIEWMKAGDLQELLLLIVWYARLDSLQQHVGLERRETVTQLKCISKTSYGTCFISIMNLDFSSQYSISLRPLPLLTKTEKKTWCRKTDIKSLFWLQMWPFSQQRLCANDPSQCLSCCVGQMSSASPSVCLSCLTNTTQGKCWGVDSSCI